MARYNVDKLLTEHTSDVTIGGGGNTEDNSDKAVLYRIADEDITGVYLANNTLLLTVDKPVFLSVERADGKRLTESDKAVVFMKDYMLMTILAMDKDGNQEMNDLLVQSIPFGFDPDLYQLNDGLFTTAATPLYYDFKPGEPYLKLPCVQGIVYEKMGIQDNSRYTPYEGEFSLSDIGGPLYAWGWPLLFELILQSSQTYKSRVRGAGTNILQKLRE